MASGRARRSSRSSSKAAKGSVSRRRRDRPEMAASDRRAQPRHDAEQILRLVAVDAILLDDMQRMADLLHMDAGQRAPGAAHGIEIAPAQILRSRARFPGAGRSERGRRRDRRSPHRRPGADPEAESTWGPSRPWSRPTSSTLPPPRSPISPSASGMPETTPSAESRASSEPERMRTGTRQRLRTVSANSTPLTASRTAAVASMSSRATPMALARRTKRPRFTMRRFDAFLVQPPVAAEPAAEAAEHLLVEQQQRRARQAVEDDETDRIRSDIDDADAPFPRASWPRARRRRAFCRAQRRGEASIRPRAVRPS